MGPHRLQRILPAMGDKRTADKGSPGKTVPQAELSQSIDNQDLGRPVRDLSASQPARAVSRART